MGRHCEPDIWEHRESEFLEDPEDNDIAEIVGSSHIEMIGRQERYQDFLSSDYWPKCLLQH
jgi:hypothetical protein